MLAKDWDGRTVSLEVSPIFLPISWFIQLLVLSFSPLLDVRPGTTRGMLVVVWVGFLGWVSFDASCLWFSQKELRKMKLVSSVQVSSLDGHLDACESIRYVIGVSRQLTSCGSCCLQLCGATQATLRIRVHHDMNS